MRSNSTPTITNAFRFLLWAESLHRQPTVLDIVTRWDCSRATAYRYRNAWLDALGLLPEPSQPGTVPPSSMCTGPNKTRCIGRGVSRGTHS